MKLKPPFSILKQNKTKQIIYINNNNKNNKKKNHIYIHIKISKQKISNRIDLKVILKEFQNKNNFFFLINLLIYVYYKCSLDYLWMYRCFTIAYKFS